MPGNAERHVGVLLLDRRGHFLDRTDHRPEGLFDPHPIDRAEQVEEFPLDLAAEADQPRRHAPLHGVAFEVVDRVQADFLADLALQLAAAELGDENLVLERADAERDDVLFQGDQLAGDLGNQGAAPNTLQFEGDSPPDMWRLRPQLPGAVFKIAVTQGNGQGVGHVGGLGKLRQAHFPLDRPLHLGLAARPAPVRIFFTCVAE